MCVSICKFAWCFKIHNSVSNYLNLVMVVYTLLLWDKLLLIRQTKNMTSCYKFLFTTVYVQMYTYKVHSNVSKLLRNEICRPQTEGTNLENVWIKLEKDPTTFAGLIAHQEQSTYRLRKLQKYSNAYFIMNSMMNSNS